MDNAANNDTFIHSLAKIMREKKKPWFDNPDDARVMCFPHIVNLASEAVIKHFTNLDYLEDLDDMSAPAAGDVVQRVRLIIKKIRASSQKTDLFSLTVEAGNKANRFRDAENNPVQLPDLRLLLDVRTRWDSLQYMVSRLLDMRPVSLPNPFHSKLADFVFVRPLICSYNLPSHILAFRISS